MIETLDISFLLATVPADPTPAAADVEITSVWDFIVRGGKMMIPIGICSLVALAVFAERLISLRRARVAPRDFLDEVNEKLKPDARSPEAALAHCDESNLPVGRLLAAGIKRLGRPVDQIEHALRESGEREVMRLRKNLRVLSVIAAITPLMGLLGTIFGMIRAFQTVAISADALGKTEKLASGIYEAMITTAAGLTVAIPVLIAFHYVSSRIERLAIDLDHDAVGFVDRWAYDAPKRTGPVEDPPRAADSSSKPSSDPPHGSKTAKKNARRCGPRRLAVLIGSGLDEMEARVELTPIIDMVFLLLIFFLVATTFHQTEREMQIALPEAMSAGPISTSLREIVINVDEAGQIIVSGRVVSETDLGAMIGEAVQANPEQKVTVRGDRNTAYANVMNVLDVCKGAGIQEPYLDTVVER